MDAKTLSIYWPHLVLAGVYTAVVIANGAVTQRGKRRGWGVQALCCRLLLPYPCASSEKSSWQSDTRADCVRTRQTRDIMRCMSFTEACFTRVRCILCSPEPPASRLARGPGAIATCWATGFLLSWRANDLNTGQGARDRQRARRRRRQLRHLPDRSPLGRACMCILLCHCISQPQCRVSFCASCIHVHESKHDC